LGERLEAAGQLSRAQLDSALAEQADTGELLGELLHRHGLVPAAQLAQQLGWPRAVAFDRAETDVEALLRLGYAFCSLYSIVPLRAAGGARVLGCAFPVAAHVLERVRRELGEDVEAAYAPLFQVRVALGRGHSALRAELHDAELGGIAALDACELMAIASSTLWDGTLAQLADRCSAAALSPIELLETSGDITAAVATTLRARTYRISTERDVAASGDVAEGPSSSGLLPPSWLQRDGIEVLHVAKDSVILASAKPTPELARAVARCLPTWAIEWRVSPGPHAGARTEPSRDKQWNQQEIMH
jgi:hypothetical protein